ncbi:MAG TPA: DNA repair protein RecO [Candidatus Sulfotelmatobacter sp.]|nr:DNA repair protein RecO [Candidatus Sulfotelmatobacter sp.]
MPDAAAARILARMHWTDAGIVLAARKHGETSAVLSLLTRQHGRHAGLVRGGAGRRLKGVLQAGNELSVEWRGRLSEHLGTFAVELQAANAALLLDDALRLAGLAAACAMAEAALPEREPHGPLYDAFRVLLASLVAGDADWPRVYARWELGLLAELGFGLDLSHCAATGAVDDLTHVSPKTGRAVSAAAARPYADRLFRLPGFFINQGGGNDAAAELRDGFALTGFFLERYVFSPHRQKMPPARTRLVERFSRPATTSGVDKTP